MGSRSRCSSAVEQLFRKQQVKGSNPFTGSPKTRSRTRNQATDWLPLRVAHAACPAIMLQCARRPGGLRLRPLAFGMLWPVRNELLPRLTGKLTGTRQPLPVPLATEREAAASLPTGWPSAACLAALQQAAFMVTGNDKRPSPGATTPRAYFSISGTRLSEDDPATAPRASCARVPTRREARRHDTEQACVPAHGLTPMRSRNVACRWCAWLWAWQAHGCGQNARTVSRGAVCTSCLCCPCRGTWAGNAGLPTPCGSVAIHAWETPPAPPVHRAAGVISRFMRRETQDGNPLLPVTGCTLDTTATRTKE